MCGTGGGWWIFTKLQRVGMASPVCDRCFGCRIERFLVNVSLVDMEEELVWLVVRVATLV